MGIGTGDRVGVEGAVEQLDPFADEDVGGVLGLDRLVEPALGFGLAIERREGADRGGPSQRQRRRLGVGLRALRPAPPAGGGRRGSQGPDDEDALALAAGARASQVAPVRQGQRAGEVELRESE